MSVPYEESEDRFTVRVTPESTVGHRKLCLYSVPKEPFDSLVAEDSTRTEWSGRPTGVQCDALGERLLCLAGWRLTGRRHLRTRQHMGSRSGTSDAAQRSRQCVDGDADGRMGWEQCDRGGRTQEISTTADRTRGRRRR
jgi:hypothetical protein